MALRTKIINFIRLYFGNNGGEVTAVGQVAVMKHKMTMIAMRILIEMNLSAGYSDYWHDVLYRVLRNILHTKPFGLKIPQDR